MRLSSYSPLASQVSLATTGMNLVGLEPWAGLSCLSGSPFDVAVVGIPYEGSAVYREGAAFAPELIRRLSAALPPVTEAGRSLSDLRLSDLGDLEVGESIESAWGAIAEKLTTLPAGTILTAIGGDHCSTIPVLAAQAASHPDLAVLWMDAHPDLCDVSRGGRWTCGCALRRALDVSHIQPSSVIIAGARDYDQEELDFIAASGIRVLGAGDLVRDPVTAGRRIGHEVGDRPLHVSFDIDALDPACAPGTEIASAGGPTTRQALDFLSAVAERTRLVGMDLVEVSPPWDHSDITVLAALKLIFEFWGLAWRAGR